MPDKAGRRDAEQGFMLLGLIVAIAIIMLFLGVAASEMAHTVRREREVESARRANQYVRAIRLFYLKNGGRYPGSVKQLENTNTIRFLRQQYVDPLTGKADYRLIAVGQNKTQVKGFFGQPLGGIASAGLGSAAGMQSSGLSIALGGAGTVGTSAADGAAGAAGANGAAGTAGGSATAGSPFSTSSFGTSSGTGSPGSTGPIMGVGSSAKGDSILVVNEQTTYQTWEFLYDPRIEKLKAAAALNAGATSVGAGALGQTPGAFGSNNGTNPNGALGGAGAAGGTNPNGGTSPVGP